MFQFLLPKGAPFFELLLEQNDILCSAANSLAQILDNYKDSEKPHREIALLEERADRIFTGVTRHLSQTFITPIDREDILHINKAQEDAVDLIQNMANRMVIFEFSRIRFPMLQLVRVLQSMTALTNSMLRGLSQKRDSHDTKAFRALRGESEMLVSVALAELHDRLEPDFKNLLEVIHWGQAYDRMELVIDKVVELAENIEEAVLKNV
jgi:uncharacterized protein Yka (UPF0111/DUF47 family)